MIRFSLIAFVSVTLLKCFVADGLGEYCLIDRLINDYLTAEDELWGFIEKREARTLQRMYDLHTVFLNRDYGESGVMRNSIFLHTRPQLIESMAEINTTSFVIAEEFFERRNYSVLSLKAARGTNLSSSFDVIYNEVVNGTEFWNKIKSFDMDCQHQTRVLPSVGQAIFEYYKEVQALALRTYITEQLSYMILHLHESGNFHELAKLNQQRFRNQTKEIRQLFKSKLMEAKREIRTCDPENYNEHGVYHEISNFLQGYVDNEVNLNADGSCAMTCSDYQNTRHFECRPDTFCAALRPEQRKIVACRGKVRGCYNFEDELSICPSETGVGRYNYIKSANGLKLGNGTSCSKEIQATAWVRWFVKCSNCFCYCDDDTDSDRYFSLHDVVSNIAENKVITGVSLTKINRMIQLIIAEGTLGSNGRIMPPNNTIILWRSGPLFNIDDGRSMDGVDFHKLTFDQRSVNLDTIVAPIGQVVTGVRFQKTKHGHLNLEIRVTDVDIIAGQLMNLEDSIWLSNPSGGKRRVNTDASDIPTKSPKPSEPVHIDDGFIRFGPTHNQIDVSQRTVPFIESLKVQPKVPAPLSGVGLYLKKQPKYGGFLAPKLIVYDFHPHIQKESH